MSSLVGTGHLSIQIDEERGRSLSSFNENLTTIVPTIYVQTVLYQFDQTRLTQVIGLECYSKFNGKKVKLEFSLMELALQFVNIINML